MPTAPATTRCCAISPRPDFQAKHTAADLAQIFIDLRRRNFDLVAVAIAAPQLSTPPYLDPDKMLRLTGYFPTRPLQINFDLIFQNVTGQWRLFGISVATPQAPECRQPRLRRRKTSRRARKGNCAERQNRIEIEALLRRLLPCRPGSPSILAGRATANTLSTTA